MRKNDEYVNRLRMRGCLCESCKCEVGEEMFAMGPGGGTLPSAHKNILCVPSYCADQVRGGEGR